MPEQRGRGRHRRQPQSSGLLVLFEIAPESNVPYLHGTAIDVEAIKLLGGLSGGVGLSEDDGGDTTAGSVLVVGEHHLLDGTCRLGKVFL